MNKQTAKYKLVLPLRKLKLHKYSRINFSVSIIVFCFFAYGFIKPLSKVSLTGGSEKPTSVTHHNKSIFNKSSESHPLNPLNINSNNPPFKLSSIENFGTGTLIIPMDNTYQGRSSSAGGFNLLAYGLAVRLLHAGVPIKWAIKSGKGKDGIDFTANAKQVSPTAGGSSSRSFRAGPIIISPGYETQAMTVINNYNNSVIPSLSIGSSYRVSVNVYELTQSANIDIKHTLTHKPTGVVLNNGGNGSIHQTMYQYAGLAQGTHYFTGLSAASLNASSCYTFASEPHSSPIDINTTIVNQVRQFLQSGGNFLGQCEAVEAYANSSNGSLLATYASKPNITGTILYDNADEFYAQFHGNLEDEGGSVESFKFTTNPGTRVAYDSNDGANYKAYFGRVSGTTTATGGYVHYLAGHDYNDVGLNFDNGYRLFLNAFLSPATRQSSCNLSICQNFTNPGAIGSDEQECQAFNPANITATSSPSGGSGVTTQYQWQSRNGTSGNWTDINGATGSTYNPPTISQTTQYRRGARRSSCSSWIYSNVVTKGLISGVDTDNDGLPDICDDDDDNDGITDANEGCPECNGNAFENGDFEQNPGTSSTIQTDASNIPAWETTSTDNLIEIWKSGYSNNSGGPVPSQSGNYHGEINATQTKALYQRVCTRPGGRISWSVWHRGRAGTDVAVVKIGGNLATSPVQTTMTTGNNAWVRYSGVYDVPSNQGFTYFIFEAVSTATNSTATGNFVDNIVIQEIIAGSCLDTDNDGIPNSKDPDSDGDGCLDVVESGGTDNNNDGKLDGTGINSNGLVTGGTGGYNGANGSENNAARLSILSQPTNLTRNNGQSATFSVSARGDQVTQYNNGTPLYGSLGNANSGLRYQWYNGTPGFGGTPISDGGVYSGATTNTLNISEVSGLNGTQYCVVVTHINNPCLEEVRCAILSVTSNEICNDGQDNDGDGLIDCADSDCSPAVASVIPTQLTCPLGANNGKIVITAVGQGTLEYSITNEPNYQTSNTFSNLGPGLYTIRVKSSTGCETTYSASIIRFDTPTCAEICNDGIDNDGDGTIDCEDSDCGSVETTNAIEQND